MLTNFLEASAVRIHCQIVVERFAIGTRWLGRAQNWARWCSYGLTKPFSWPFRVPACVVQTMAGFLQLSTIDDTAPLVLLRAQWRCPGCGLPRISAPPCVRAVVRKNGNLGDFYLASSCESCAIAGTGKLCVLPQPSMFGYCISICARGHWDGGGWCAPVQREREMGSGRQTDERRDGGEKNRITNDT